MSTAIAATPRKTIFEVRVTVILFVEVDGDQREHQVEAMRQGEDRVFRAIRGHCMTASGMLTTAKKFL